MGVNDWSQAEKDLYALGSRALFDDMERYRRELSEGVALDTTATDAMIAEAAARTKAAQEETRRYLAQLAGDEPAPIDPQDQAVGASAAAGSSSPAMPGGGPGPGQPLTFEDVRAAEMAEADRIRNLSLQDFAVEREHLIRSRTSRGMFG